MYKLVAIGGKIRGEEFVLEEGENTLGRDSECSIHLPVNGISKKHLSITVTKDVAYIQDLGSSNGTFVNGKMIKRATVKDKDKIALPDVILQVVHVEEKKIVIKKKVKSDEDDDEDYMTGGEPPKALPRKLLHIFKYKIMNFLYGINEEYEWRILLGILTSIFVVITIALTILPVLSNSRSVLKKEVAKRGGVYADMVARLNSRALEQKNLDQIDTAFLDREPGIDSYELFDLEGRIVRPIGKLNSFIQDTFSIRARDWALKNTSTNEAVVSLSGGQIGIARRIMAFNPKYNDTEAVGVIAIKFAPESILVEAKRNQKDFFEALVTSSLVAIIFGLVVYYLTVRHLEEFRFQVEEALRGKRKSLETRYLMNEISPLRNSINSILQRLRELNNEEDDDFAELEEDGPYVEQLGEFMRGGGVATLILNSQKQVEKINDSAEEITGIRQDSSQGMDLLDVAREKGFAGTLIELCDQSANNAGTNQEGTYELSGKDYDVHVAALMGKDGFAKAFYITFIREE
ncbi:MAG: FHA domain-containing protein [Bacteriovoracaceae bacterium]|nr:FHA domain-containing protein [Bacteriovoracaceae bacterium]